MDAVFLLAIVVVAAIGYAFYMRQPTQTLADRYIDTMYLMPSYGLDYWGTPNWSRWGGRWGGQWGHHGWGRPGHGRH